MKGNEMASRIVGLAMLASGLACIATTPALAGWLVNGTELKSGESAALASLTDPISAGILHVAPTAISTECEGPTHIVGARLITPNLEYVQEIILLNCHTIPPTNTHCQLAGTTLTTRPMLATVTLTRLIAKPVEGKLIMEVPFASGTICVIEGNQPVKGEGVGSLPHMTTAAVGQPLVALGSVENNSLEVGSGNKGFLLGSVQQLLASRASWGFR